MIDINLHLWVNLQRVSLNSKVSLHLFANLVYIDIKYLSAGENHAAAIDGQGNAWAWGKNDSSQCGVHGAASIISPPQVVNLQVQIQATHNKEQTIKKDKAIMVACGGQHTLFLSHENDVFAVGNNSQG